MTVEIVGLIKYWIKLLIQLIISPRRATKVLLGEFGQSGKLSQIVQYTRNELTVFNLIFNSVGCPGQAKDGVLVSASNFPLFRNFPFSDSLSKKLDGIPVVLINDTDAAIIAEVFGSGAYAGLSNAAMVTLGTGIGLGLVLEGKLYQGSHGLIEGGHMIIEADASNGRSCPCGQIGCAEAYASAKSTSVRMFEVDGNGANSDAPSVFARAASGDRRAQSILDETAEKLAILCINICRVVDPSVIILGGGKSHYMY
jgi:glucokinase